MCAHCAAGLDALELGDFGRVTLTEGVCAIGMYAYDGVIQAAIRTMKTPGHHAPAAGFGRMLRAGLPGVMRSGWPITWVPSTRRRLRQRGADIPRLLAGPSARALLARVRERPDQTSLDARRRRTNPLGVFSARGRSPTQVILVDDVRTTGSTALAAASALLDAGATRVLVVTLAVAGGAPGRPLLEGGLATVGQPRPADFFVR